MHFQTTSGEMKHYSSPNAYLLILYDSNMALWYKQWDQLSTDWYVGGARAYCVAKKLPIAPSCGYQEITTILFWSTVFVWEKKKKKKITAK